LKFIPTIWCLGIVCLIPIAGSGQVVKVDSITHWKKAFRIGLNLNQASFSSNWKAGGVNSLGFNTLLNFKANYRKDLHSWDNEIDLLFGLVNNEGQGRRKTLDRIFMDTKYGRKLNKNWDAILSSNLQTQFAAGYNYITDSVGASHSSLISDFFAPAFITAALGFEWHPVEYFKLRLSPLAPRVTIVNNAQRFVTADNPRPYGVDPVGTTRFEWYAFQLLAEFNKAQIHRHIEPMLAAALDLGITPFLDLILTSPRASLQDLAETLREAYRWLRRGCEVGMYPYVIPFSGAGLARDPELVAHTIYAHRQVAGTDVAWDQPAKILPIDATVREVIVRIEQDFEKLLNDLQQHVAHLPSRVRSLVWILCSVPVLAEHGIAIADEREVRAELHARLPQARRAVAQPAAAFA